MRTQALLVAGATAAAAAAANTSPNPLAQIVKRQLEVGEECQAALEGGMDIVTTIPQPPTDPAFLEFLGEQSAPSDLGDCDLPAVTGDAEQASVYSSYLAEVTAWVEQNGEDLLNIVSACATEPVFSSALQSLSLPVGTGTVCSEYTWVTADGAEETSSPTASDDASPTASDDATPTDDSEESGSSEEPSASDSAEESESESPAAAPRQTGMAMAAMAVAGFAYAAM